VSPILSYGVCLVSSLEFNVEVHSARLCTVDLMEFNTEVWWAQPSWILSSGGCPVNIEQWRSPVASLQLNIELQRVSVGLVEHWTCLSDQLRVRH
jgi:hypothetical protein